MPGINGPEIDRQKFMDHGHSSDLISWLKQDSHYLESIHYPRDVTSIYNVWVKSALYTVL